jgi:hypothetical protein
MRWSYCGNDRTVGPAPHCILYHLRDIPNVSHLRGNDRPVLLAAKLIAATLHSRPHLIAQSGRMKDIFYAGGGTAIAASIYALYALLHN